MIINVHSNYLIEALDEVFLSLEECVAIGDNIIEIIHGFHGGQVIKNRLCSKRFLREALKEGFTLLLIDNQDEGSTEFEIK